MALEFSALQLNFISAFGNLGQYTGILGGPCNIWCAFDHSGPGLFYDRFGPRYTSIVAATLLFSGYASIFASLRQYIPSSFFSVAIFAFCVGQGMWATRGVSHLCREPRHLHIIFEHKLEAL
jgi:hypothetical protein